MLHAITVAIADGQLGPLMAKMRTWLDDRRLELDAVMGLRQNPWRGGHPPK